MAKLKKGQICHADLIGGIDDCMVGGCKLIGEVSLQVGSFSTLKSNPTIRLCADHAVVMGQEIINCLRWIQS